MAITITMSCTKLIPIYNTILISIVCKKSFPIVIITQQPFVAYKDIDDVSIIEGPKSQGDLTSINCHFHKITTCKNVNKW